MKHIKKLSLIIAGISLSSLALADEQKIYFNQLGKLSNNMAEVSYVREYQTQGQIAQVQDFYYPSHRKYSDPYQIPISQIRQFVPQLQNGTLILWHFNGTKKMVAPYQDGKPHGMWINWYSNGKRSAVMPYLQGKTAGTGARYYRSGGKESEIEFRNDRANGKWRQWYASGRLKSEAIMKDDAPVSLNSWNEQGRLTVEMTWQDGQRNGVVLEWYPNGNKLSEAVYINDEIVSHTKWKENGEVTE